MFSPGVCFPRLTLPAVSRTKALILAGREQQARQLALLDLRGVVIARLSPGQDPPNLADKVGAPVLVVADRDTGRPYALLDGVDEQATHAAALVAASPHLYQACVMACQVLNNPELQPALPWQQHARQQAHEALLEALARAHAEISFEREEGAGE